MVDHAVAAVAGAVENSRLCGMPISPRWASARLLPPSAVCVALAQARSGVHLNHLSSFPGPPHLKTKLPVSGPRVDHFPRDGWLSFRAMPPPVVWSRVSSSRGRSGRRTHRRSGSGAERSSCPQAAAGAREPPPQRQLEGGVVRETFAAESGVTQAADQTVSGHPVRAGDVVAFRLDYSHWLSFAHSASVAANRSSSSSRSRPRSSTCILWIKASVVRWSKMAI